MSIYTYIKIENKSVGGNFMEMAFNLVSGLYMILILALVGVGVYCLILFIKLANRGIKALDIYINEKTNNKL